MTVTDYFINLGYLVGTTVSILVVALIFFAPAMIGGCVYNHLFYKKDWGHYSSSKVEKKIVLYGYLFYVLIVFLSIPFFMK